ncbi:MAG: ABC transporter permease subunit [Planctomycetota bacterium]
MKVIWAIARNTLAQAVRMKVAAVLILLFLLTAAILPFTLEADETQLGEVKVLLTYNLTIGMGLLTILTILLSASVLDTEIVGRQIYLVCTKPVHRWQILLGKWIGVVALDAVLLAVLGGLTAGLVYYRAREDPKRPDEFRVVREQVLTSRRSIHPPEFDIEARIKDYKSYLISQGSAPEEVNTKESENYIRGIVQSRRVRLAPGMSEGFTLVGIPRPVDPEKSLYTIRYKLYAADETEDPLRGQWRFVRPSEKPVPQDQVFAHTEAKTGETREFQIPAAYVNEKGELFVQFTNLTIGIPEMEEKYRKDHAVYFLIEDGLELLAPSGSFLLNLAKGLALLLVRLALFAAVGVSATTLMHFPVAVLLLILVAVSGYSRDFIITRIESDTRRAKLEEMKSKEEQQQQSPGAYGLFLREVYYPFLERAIRVAPDFTKTDPVYDLKVGREILSSRLFLQTSLDLLLRGGVVALLGLFFFYRRELARPYL